MTTKVALGVHDAHEQLHAELVEEFGWETEGWVRERLDRVMLRLSANRMSGKPALVAESPTLPTCIAFTTPSTYIYVSRKPVLRILEPSTR